MAKDALQRCLHCGIALLRDREFPDMEVEHCIHDLLEVITDYIGGYPLDEQMRLFQLAEQMMMRNRNAVLNSTWKRDSSAAAGELKEGISP